MKDSELIQKVHSGNKEAVGIIIERYYADVYRFCLYMVQTEDDAYDIAQETFLKFMKYGTSYKHHNLKGYLLTIARNICFNYFRDKKEKVTAIEWEEIDKIPNNKDMLTEAEDAVYLRNLLKELSQDTREVIILRNTGILLGRQSCHAVLFRVHAHAAEFQDFKLPAARSASYLFV